MQYRRGQSSPWVVQIRNPVTRERETHSFIKKTDAEDFEWMRKREIQCAKKRIQLPVNESVLITTAFDEYLKERRDEAMTGERALSSVYTEDTRSSFWRGLWDHRTTVSITSMEVDSALRALMHVHGRAVATRNRHLALLNTFFEWCQKKRYADDNPAAEFEIIRERKVLQVRPHGVWKEFRHVEMYIGSAYRFGIMWGCLAVWLAYVGNRISEATALRFEDIDFELGSVRLHAIVDRRGKIVQRLKGDGAGGERQVMVPDLVLEAIVEWRKVSPFSRDSDLIFCQRRGKPLCHHYVWTKHYEIIEAAGVPEITVHGIRHSCSHMLKTQGATDTQRREQLGQRTMKAAQRYDHDDIQSHIKGLRQIGHGMNKNNVFDLNKKESS